MKLQLRLEATNALNTVNLSNPFNALNSATFGQIRSARNMREAQLGARLSFQRGRHMQAEPGRKIIAL